MAIWDIFKGKEKREITWGDLYGISQQSGLNIVSFHSNSDVSLSAVFSAIELISNTLAEIPIEVRQRDDNHQTHTLRQHAVKFALSNSQTTRFILIKCMVADMLKHGNGFAYLKRATDGTVTEIIYVPATEVNIFFNRNTRAVYYSVQHVGKVLPADIIHIYMRSDDGINGISLLKFAARTVESANYVENAALDYFAKGMHSVGLLHAKSPMIGKQAEDAKKLVTGEINTTKAQNLVKFLPYDLEYTSLQNDPTKSQLIEARKFNISEIARFFNLPLAMLDGQNVSDFESLNI